ncbi:hypothetical protein PR202_gb25526 [Eleusine coracana subsp. coracana]|uniref:L-gulonolactone oxidase n=1 Tax=Eleusine coracana subsp. coracana TaxID=191504 RepID=A0AAV5FQU1_ELECO|nr:hypothetical protein PR202_gb25526 [Eleusine coracana subsp. coracana]
MALPNTPYFYGLTVGGLLATGAHGSSLMRKGGAVHEHVVKVRIVTPAPPSEKSSEKLAIVREIATDDPDLNAAKVSLGVLGVISQLDPLFKRSLTILRNDSDTDLVELVSMWGHKHEFGDIYWLPGQGKVLLGQIDRVDVSTPGDGLNQAFFPPRPISDIVRERSQEDQLQELGSDDAFCQASAMLPTALQEGGFGFLNDGKNFTGYPVVGYNNKMQASGSCIFSPEDGPEVCVWNPRINGTFVHDTGLSVALSDAPAFVSDLMRLRDRNPKAFCTLDLHLGILFRYIKKSTAYLGKARDSVEFDMIYYRSREPSRPVRHADLTDEIEQIALYKYGGLPHWGKNRNYVFNDTVGKFPKLREFLDVKARFDPDGIFSSQWSDQVLGINGSPVISGPGCAVEGLCTCTKDSDCAPGYLCSNGKVYLDARVCTVPVPQ